MKFIRGIKRLARWVDDAIACGALRLFGEKSGLITFLYHSLFETPAEIELNLIDPMEKVTLADFRCMIDYFLENHYFFVTPAQILAGLDRSRRYALISFDDGYANNLHALDVLKEFNVPAVLFIATDHIASGRCFWWDVLYRERMRRRTPLAKIELERAMLKQKTAPEITAYLESEFGAEAFRPRGDLDRPMTMSELSALANEELVTLGNHTKNHAILTNYTLAEAEDEISGCQQFLQKITGEAPTIISYPNGNYSSEIVSLCRRIGLRLGLTVVPGKNRLPLPADNRLLMLRRFIPKGGQRSSKQFELMRADYSLARTFFQENNRGY